MLGLVEWPAPQRRRYLSQSTIFLHKGFAQAGRYERGASGVPPASRVICIAYHGEFVKLLQLLGNGGMVDVGVENCKAGG